MAWAAVSPRKRTPPSPRRTTAWSPPRLRRRLLLIASLHYAASIPNALALEWDQNPNGLRDELLKEGLKLESDGTVKLPERPGLGIELDRAAVDKYRVG